MGVMGMVSVRKEKGKKNDAPQKNGLAAQKQRKMGGGENRKCHGKKEERREWGSEGYGKWGEVNIESVMEKKIREKRVGECGDVRGTEGRWRKRKERREKMK